MGCRLPGGVRGPAALWTLLENRVDAIRDVPPERWNHSLYYDPESGKPGRTPAKQAGFIDEVDRFDAACFGISPREAAFIDPQHRLALEVTWDALEDAGQRFEQIAGSATAVFMGISTHEYSMLQTIDSLGMHASTGQAACMAANRVSYAFDFRGPSISVDTACSSALNAVHLACRSLWNGDATMAVAGGVNAFIDPTTFVSFSALGMLSPDSRCKAFDEGANGFVRAEGGGALILKPLSRAQADGDPIQALIMATGSNQDGHSQGGLTLPSEEAQEALLRAVYAQAGVPLERVRYVEAHGTGTQAGDPVEANALGRVLGVGRGPGAELVIGSVKTNIGHMEAGAGAAGMIKACLVLRHRKIPANLHFKRPNPRIDFQGLGLRVAAEPEAITDAPGFVVGVNGFGFGGANAHVVLCEYVAPLSAVADAGRAPAAPGPVLALPLSARSPESLKALAAACDESLAVGDVAPADLAHTAGVKRSAHSHRLVVTGSTTDELRAGLQAAVAGRETPGLVTGRARSTAPRVAYVFTGQGPQWWAMGRELLAGEPVFFKTVEVCDRVIRSLGGWSLLEELRAPEAVSRMNVTAIAQPAIYAIQAGLQDLWKTWGVRPEAVIGHSVGEIAAAYAAGGLSLVDGARVAFHRGRTMDRATSRGAMIAAGLSEAEARPWIERHPGRVDIAAINSPRALTLSGDPAAVAAIAAGLDAHGVFNRKLRVEYAFHSAQMDPVESDLRAALAGLEPARASAARLVSTVTGAWASGDEWDVGYWWKNLRQSVRFADGMKVLLSEGIEVFLEVGPHPALAAPMAECARQAGKPVVVLGSLRREHPEREGLLRTLAAMQVQGQPVCWEAVNPPGGAVAFPLYPWKRERHWAAAVERTHSLRTAADHPLLGARKLDARPVWENRCDLRLAPWLADHRLHGAVIFPAAAYLDMAIAAGLVLLQAKAVVLEDIEIGAPCFMATGETLPMTLRFGADESRFEIFSHPKLDGAWVKHVGGRVLPAASGAATTRDLDSLKAAMGEPVVAAAATYASFEAQGLGYGPAFRGLRQTWRRDGEALGEVRLPQEAGLAAGYGLHPALLDACLQTTLEAVPVPARKRKTFLPVGVAQLRFHRPAGDRVYSHVCIREISTESLVADISLLDDEGAEIAVLKGFRCRAVALEGQAEEGRDLLLVSEWESQPRPAEVAGDAQAERWLVLDHAGGLGARLRVALTTGKRTVLLARAGAAFAGTQDGDFVFNPGLAGDWGALIKAVAPGAPLTRVVDLRALDLSAEPSRNPGEVGEDGLVGALGLVQALAAWPDLAPPRWWLVTNRAQPVGPEEGAGLAMAQAALWGFRRVAAFEQPRLRPVALDVSDLASETEFAALVAELRGDPDEDEIALRVARRFVHRCQRRSFEQCNPPRVITTDTGAESLRVVTSRPGSLDHLHLAARERPVAGPGELRIAVKAAALNFSDVLKALGLYPGVTPETFSLGAECAGVVEDPGGASDWRVGDRVLAIAPHALGSHVITRRVHAVRVPEGLSFAEAAAVPIVFLTAHYALQDIARLRKGERVLIHAATGGVGLAAIQIARHIGAEIYATAGTPEKRDYLRSLGVEHVMDSRTLSFADEIQEKTGGEGVDVVLNSLAGEAIAKGLASLRPFGRFVEIGKRDLYANTPLGLRPFRNNITFGAVDLDQAIRTRPDLVARLFREVMEGFAAGAYQPLPVRVFATGELVEAFRHLSKAQHIGKVIVSFEPARVPVTFPPATVAVRADATYFVAGGAGGFSWVLAEWLAKRGARHVVLASRRGPAAPEAAAAVVALGALGCAARVVACDVTDRTALTAVLAEIERTMPPLAGVVHSAMVIDDGAIVRMDAQRLRRVTGVKMAGAWNLHELTLGRSLDFFLMTSSIASLYGSPGQCHYAAANTFLDLLAHHRRGLGLSALAVNLGALASVGHITRHADLEAHLERIGVAMLNPSEVLAALEKLLGGPASQVAVARVDFDRLAHGRGALRLPPRFRELASSALPGVADGSAHPLLAELRALGPAEGLDRLRGALLAEVGRVLGVSADRCEVDRPLTELGLDSLMMVELVSWVEDTLKLKLPAVELMRNPSISGLSAVLMKHLAVAGGGAVPVETAEGEDLRGDAQLDPSILPEAGGHPREVPEAVLLTGATGFVGAFLLAELLRHTEATVYCLVRAADAEEGFGRIEKAFSRYGIQAGNWRERVRPVPGDLGQPLCGLTPADFAGLASALDAIYHVGATVDFIQSYAAVRGANVQGTQEILRLASTGRPKRLHHVSSVAAFSVGDYAGEIAEATIPEAIAGLPDGYSRSKWVSEQLVHEAIRRGLAARIYRLGVIGGHSVTGVANSGDASLQILTASVLVGRMPSFPWFMNMTAVDHAADAIRRIAALNGEDGRIFHVCAPKAVGHAELMRWSAEAGFPLERVPYADWRGELGTQLAGTPLAGLLALVPEDEGEACARFNAVARPFGTDHTRRAMEAAGGKWDVTDEAGMRAYLRRVMEARASALVDD